MANAVYGNLTGQLLNLDPHAPLMPLTCSFVKKWRQENWDQGIVACIYESETRKAVENAP